MQATLRSAAPTLTPFLETEVSVRCAHPRKVKRNFLFKYHLLKSRILFTNNISRNFQFFFQSFPNNMMFSKKFMIFSFLLEIYFSWHFTQNLGHTIFVGRWNRFKLWQNYFDKSYYFYDGIYYFYDKKYFSSDENDSTIIILLLI